MQAAHKDTSARRETRQKTQREKLAEISSQIFADAKRDPKRYATESEVPAGGE